MAFNYKTCTESWLKFIVFGLKNILKGLWSHLSLSPSLPALCYAARNKTHQRSVRSIARSSSRRTHGKQEESNHQKKLSVCVWNHSRSAGISCNWVERSQTATVPSDARVALLECKEWRLLHQLIGAEVGTTDREEACTSNSPNREVPPVLQTTWRSVYFSLTHWTKDSIGRETFVDVNVILGSFSLVWWEAIRPRWSWRKCILLARSSKRRKVFLKQHTKEKLLWVRHAFQFANCLLLYSSRGNQTIKSTQKRFKTTRLYLSMNIKAMKFCLCRIGHLAIGPTWARSGFSTTMWRY